MGWLGRESPPLPARWPVHTTNMLRMRKAWWIPITDHRSALIVSTMISFERAKRPFACNCSSSINVVLEPSRILKLLVLQEYLNNRSLRKKFLCGLRTQESAGGLLSCTSGQLLHRPKPKMFTDRFRLLVFPYTV